MKTLLRLSFCLPALLLPHAVGGDALQPQAIDRECSANCMWTCRQQYPLPSPELSQCYQACIQTYCQ
jgi:hypothetical protein